MSETTDDNQPAERHRAFKEAVEPLIKWMAENQPSPHCYILVTSQVAQFLSGELAVQSRTYANISEAEPSTNE